MAPAPNPRRDAPPSKLASLGTVLALVTLLTLLIATILVLPLLGFIGMAVLLGAVVFGGVALVHYLVWGRWIARIIERDEQQ